MVEPIYTSDQINQINIGRSAINDLVYTDDGGNKFVGTVTGNLKLLQKASVSPIDEINRMDALTVQKAFEELNERVIVVEEDYVLHQELQAAKDDCKSFALAMSLIL